LKKASYFSILISPLTKLVLCMTGKGKTLCLLEDKSPGFLHLSIT
jgi:hypothetical protein